MRVSDYQEAMDTHFFGPLFLVQAVLPGMRAEGRGAHRQHQQRGREGADAAPAAVRREQVRAGGLERGAARRAPEGRHRRHHRLPRAHAHRQPAARRGEGRSHRGRVRLVQAARLASLRLDERPDGGRDHRPRESSSGSPSSSSPAAPGPVPGSRASPRACMSELLALGARLLPRPRSPEDFERWSGAESESPLTRSFVTGLTQRAEVENNERPAPRESEPTSPPPRAG